MINIDRELINWWLKETWRNICTVSIALGIGCAVLAVGVTPIVVVQFISEPGIIQIVILVPIYVVLISAVAAAAWVKDQNRGSGRSIEEQDRETYDAIRRADG